jgi:hypothetical protein
VLSSERSQAFAIAKRIWEIYFGATAIWSIKYVYNTYTPCENSYGAGLLNHGAAGRVTPSSESGCANLSTTVHRQKREQIGE